MRTRAGGTWVAARAALKYAALGLGAAIMVLPFMDMFIGALRGPADVFASPPRYFPAELPKQRWLFNSVVVTVTITLFQVVTSTMAGYALARYRFPGRDGVFRLVLGAQMFPFFLFIILISGAFTDLDQKSLQQAALAVSVLPVAIVFLVLQRFHVSAELGSAVK